MSSDLPDGLAMRVSGVTKMFRLQPERPGSVLGALTGFHRRRYQEFWALREVDVDVPTGSMLGIIGHNGSGKSTLLRLMAGVYRPTTGQIAVRGRIAPLLELGSGFHNELSGIDNIYLNAAVHGLDRDYVATILDDIIAMADIGDFIESPIEVYSSGMRSRLAFAVSVHLDPDILLADEITSVGDVAFAQRCMNHFYKMRSEGTTVVLVSHNLTLVQRMADSVMWLERGQVRGYGDPAQMIDAYREAMAVTDWADAELEEEFIAPTDSLQVLGPLGDEYGYTGEFLDIWSEYSLPGPVQRGRITMHLQHQGGPLPLHRTIDVTPDAPLPIRGEISCRIDVLPLPPGHYGLIMRVFDEDKDGYVFEVRRPIRVRPQRDDQVVDGLSVGGTMGFSDKRRSG